MGSGRRRGFAIVVVLLVLLALLVLATPFLAMARNAESASSQLADRTGARLALDTAARHGRHLLAESHPSLDRTPYFDGLDELAVDNRFDPSFYDASDPRSTMWDADARDVAGLIDLNSASPHVLANLIGATTRLSEAVEYNAEELQVSSTAGFEPAGYLWIEGETVRYASLAGGTFGELTRGLFSKRNAEGEWMDGPRPRSDHGLGAPVLDQRALGPALWRAGSADGELRAFESPAELRGGAGFMLAVAEGGATDLAEDAIATWTRFGTVDAGVRGGRVWQRAARLVEKVEGGISGRLELDDARWINPGSTVRVEDGTSAEIALVQAVEQGAALLDRVLEHSYESYEAEVRVLVRRPVNVNTAPPEVLAALFENLQLVGRNARVTAGEARELAALVVESRPFEGHEDFLRRVVLPAAGLEKLPAGAPVVPDSLAAGSGFIDADDALALYANAQNANDGRLAFSTMPLCYTSRDVFALDLRASVNAPNGVERAAAVRETVDLVVPQKELLALFARQEDFDEAFRLDREAPRWMTGPEATSPYDGGAEPPSRLWPHMGTVQGMPYLPGVTAEPTGGIPEDATPEHVFASREEDGWAQLAPGRVAETQRLQDRVLHFDHETRDPEGRYLPDEPVQASTDDALVNWTATGAVLLRPFALSLWVRPRQVGDSILFDVGGADLETDRASLLLEGSDLVLRVIDGPGDHRDTAFREVGELRFALTAGEDPGLPADTWSHVAFDVRGNRPDQMAMLVNGLAHGVRTPGLTQLTGGVGPTDAVLSVESTEGFPPRCVVRVGGELAECRVDGATALRAEHVYTGAEAGFGGRSARIEFASDDPADGPANPPDSQHAQGTPVELYGYSLELAQGGVPAGSASLPDELGPFRAAMLAGVRGGSQAGGDPIVFPQLTAQGIGMEGAGSAITDLVLRSADNFDLDPVEYMDAFNKRGGYAAIVQVSLEPLATVRGSPVGGAEVIRYSGWDIDQDTGVLHIAARGHVVASELPNYGGSGDPDVGLARAFVLDWGNLGLESNAGFELIGDRPDWQPYVVPISLPVPGATGMTGFLPAEAGASEFAQITHLDDAELTEWVRYDWFQEAFGQLVRDAPVALKRLVDEADGAFTTVTLRDRPPGGPGGPGDPGGGGPGGGGGAAFLAASVSLPPVARPQISFDDPSLWVPAVGEPDAGEEDFPRSRAFADDLRFRGVLATFRHSHPAGTVVLPVFSTPDRGPDAGRPGRLDAAFLVAGQPDHIGWPVIVHRAHKPSATVASSSWDYASSALVPDAAQAQDGFDRTVIRVALQDRAPEPIAAGTPGGAPATPGGGGSSTGAVVDSRLLGRLTLFPSGERPRVVTSVTVGGVFNGEAASVPAAVVDEIAFGDARFAAGGTGAAGGSSAEATAGGQLVLAAECSETDDEIAVFASSVRLAGQHAVFAAPILIELPVDAGLLRIGSEILAYDACDIATGRLTLAASGRGLLGTSAQAHAAGEPITFLEHVVTTALTGDVGPGDARLSIEDATDFPPEGTVLIGDELIHYTALREAGLWMPSRSTEPGRMDGRGEGLFRGRFGTVPSGHSAGECVILFPFRYWDRWAEQADAPELAYLGLALDQPAAFWRSTFWTAEEAGEGARLGVLLRSDPDVPWDADPETAAGLALDWTGTSEGKPIVLGEQSDRIEWRVHVDYSPGAFDATTGLPHGWKQTPRLRHLGAFYLGPSLTLRSVDR